MHGVVEKSKRELYIRVYGALRVPAIALQRPYG